MNRRTMLPLAAALLVPWASPGVGPAVAVVAPSCQGEAATVVGSPSHDVVRGTPGRDVIVSRGAFEVHALGGDDLVCVTDAAGAATGNVYAGAGDDEVHVDTARPEYVFTELGSGADEFHGGIGQDVVWAGQALAYDHQGPQDARDGDRDVISTGRSWDTVIVGQPGVEMLDDVDTGTGEDEVRVQATAGDGGMLHLGPGYDSILFDWPDAQGGAWLFDNTSGTATEDGTPRFAWTGVEDFTLPEPGANAVSFIGGDGDETVSAASVDRVDLAGGNDMFVAEAGSPALGSRARGSIDGGPGQDGLQVNDYLALDIDLAEGWADFENDQMSDQSLAGVENVEVYGGRGPVEVHGDGGANVMTAQGCRVTVRGAGGDDRVAGLADRCGERSTADLHGGPGDDVLRGGEVDDLLHGGTGDDAMFGHEGRDRAHGGEGRDTCAAEVRHSCALPQRR